MPYRRGGFQTRPYDTARWFSELDHLIRNAAEPASQPVQQQETQTTSPEQEAGQPETPADESAPADDTADDTATEEAPATTAAPAETGTVADEPPATTVPARIVRIGVAFPDEFDDLMETGVAIAGTPAQARAKMAALAADSGVNYLVCRMAFGDLSYEEAARTVDLLTREVLPGLRAAA